MKRFFCSEQSRARTEPMYGTAARVRTWLLIEYPGIWRPNAVEDSTLSPLVKQRLLQLANSESLHRQVFIRQTHKRSETTRCFIVRSSESSPSIVRADVATCDGPITSIEPADAQPISEPMFLVCTHGNHDMCCSKWGLPVYYAARQLAREQAWQCSHIGGDRFAGNLVCFPHGIYYGHVWPDDVPELMDSYRRGEINLKHYRGRCCYPRAVQVAEYFARAETGMLRIDDLRFESATRGSEWQVRFRSERSVLDVRVRTSEGALEALTCKAQRPGPIPKYELLGFRTSAL